MPERKKGKKNRKHGRNKRKCEDYLRRGKHIKSRIKRLRKHLSQHSGDGQAKKALKRLEGFIPTAKIRVRRGRYDSQDKLA